MGRLHVSDRIFLARLLKSILEHNFLKVAQLHFDKGILPTGSSIEAFAQEIRSLSTPILDKKLGQISLGTLLGELFGLASKWRLKIQPQFLLLQKTMVMAEGIGRQLNPETDMWVMSKPLVNDWLSSNDLKKKFVEEVYMDLKMTSKKLPELIYKVDLILDHKNENNVTTLSNTFKVFLIAIITLLIIIFLI